MKEDRHKAVPEKVQAEVENCVDYLWLMRSFEEELAKEAQDLLKQVKQQQARLRYEPAKSR